MSDRDIVLTIRCNVTTAADLDDLADRILNFLASDPDDEFPEILVVDGVDWTATDEAE